MGKRFFLLVVLVFLLLEATLAKEWRVFWAKPNLLLAAALTAPFYFPLKWALFFAFLAGSLKDIFCAGPYAVHWFLFPGLAYLAAAALRKVSLENLYFRSLFIFLFTFLGCLGMRGILAFEGVFIGAGVFFRVAFLESLYTAIAAFLFFRVVKR